MPTVTGNRLGELPAGLAVMASPDWMLAGFDPVHDVYQFARVTRATYRESAFLDHRIRPVPAAVRSLAGAEVDRVLRCVAPRPAGWIFHTAFCASTLLATCLDHEGQTLVLREPAVLSRLAALERRTGVGGDAAARRRVLALTERSYGAERLIVKPSNYANALLGPVLGLAQDGEPARRCVLLSSSLTELLVSLLNKRAEAEKLMASFTAALLSDTDYSARTGHPPLERLALLQQGVLFWHCQRYHFQRCLGQAEANLVLPLTMANWLDQPAATLTRVSAFLGLGLDGATIAHTVADGAFRRHAKSGTDFGPERRGLESVEARARHEDEIAAALDWARCLLRALPVEPLMPGEDPVGA